MTSDAITDVSVVRVTVSDWPAVRAIYEQGVAAGVRFRRAGIRERIGQHFGRWRDVVLLERRRAGD